MAQSFLSSQNMLSVYIFAIAVVLLSIATPNEANCDLVENDLTQSDIYLKLLNKRRLNLAEGKQSNGPSGGFLPKGNVGEMKWDCELERKAIDSLNSDGCKKKPNVPNGMTGFFDYVKEDDDRLSGMEMWLSEIDYTSMDATVKEGAVRYHNKNGNYSNLVRQDATRIGCAKKFCATRIRCGKKSCTEYDFRILCLTDKSPLKTGEIIYQTRT